MPVAAMAGDANSDLRAIHEDEARSFQADGVCHLPNLIPLHWIERLRDGVAANMAAPSPFGKTYTPQGQPGGFFGDYCNWRHFPDYRDFVLFSGIGGVAAALMGTRTARIFHEHVLVKEPGTRDRTPWHHDQPYYCVDGQDVVSLWIPLDPVPRETAVEFVAGSHRWGKSFVPTKFSGMAYDRAPGEAEPIPNIDADRSSYDIRGFAMEPGDAMAFHFMTVHGAPGNPSQNLRRRAFAARFLGDDAVYGERSGEVSPPFPEIRGKLKTGDALPESLFPRIWPTQAVEPLPDHAAG